MKKKLVALLVMATLVFGITACGSSEAPSNDADNSNVENEVDGDTEVELESEGTLIFDLPEGWTYDEASDLYYGPNYPNEMANINYYSIANDGSFGLLTQAMMEEALEESLTSAYGEAMDIEFTKWEEATVDGYESIEYTITYEYAGFEIAQTQVIVNGKDNFHYLTLTEATAEGYAETFNTIIDSMRFE